MGKQNLPDFLQGEDGATAIEYGLIAALIAVSIIVSLSAFTTNVSAKYDFITTTIQDALD